MTIYLFLLRVGRLIAKALGLETNSFVRWTHAQILARALPPATAVPTVPYWDHDFLVLLDLSMLPGLLNHTYEKHELKFVTSSLRPGQVFVDVGANFGLYSVLASQLVGNVGRVFSFEPAPPPSRCLSKTPKHFQM